MTESTNKEKIKNIKITCPKCGQEFQYGEIQSQFQNEFAKIGGAAGKGKKNPAAAANLAKARAARDMTSERRREILAKARAAKAAKKAANEYNKDNNK